MKKTKKPTKKPSQTVDLQRRIQQLEKRPTVFQIDPEKKYLVLVPEKVIPDDFDSLAKYFESSDNVVLIQADTIHIVKVE